MKLTINKEYFRRHLFVTLLMAGLGAWFGYDGFVRYPATSADALYRSIEKSAPPAGMNLETFKRQKIQTQYGFTFICFLAALIVGLRLKRSSAFRFEYDLEKGAFTANGKNYTRSDIAKIDQSQWESKRILRLTLKDGTSVQLDAWHHLGVKEFAQDFLALAPTK